MGESDRKSIYGDAEARRRRTLDAAAALLDEGGYTALTIRSVAKRAGTSVGLIYQYFKDKPDIFVALLTESKGRARASIAALPRDQGVETLLATIISESVRQWARVGRYTATWRDMDGATHGERESVRQVREAARLHDAELHRALLEAAENEGRTLRADPALLPFVLSGIQGVADTIVHQWAKEVSQADLVAFAAASLTQAITAP